MRLLILACLVIGLTGFQTSNAAEKSNYKLSNTNIHKASSSNKLNSSLQGCQSSDCFLDLAMREAENSNSTENELNNLSISLALYKLGKTELASEYFAKLQSARSVGIFGLSWLATQDKSDALNLTMPNWDMSKIDFPSTTFSQNERLTAMRALFYLRQNKHQKAQEAARQIKDPLELIRYKMSAFEYLTRSEKLIEAQEMLLSIPTNMQTEQLMIGISKWFEIAHAGKKRGLAQNLELSLRKKYGDRSIPTLITNIYLDAILNDQQKLNKTIQSMPDGKLRTSIIGSAIVVQLLFGRSHDEIRQSAYSSINPIAVTADVTKALTRFGKKDLAVTYLETMPVKEFSALGFCAIAAQTGNQLDFDAFKKNSSILEANSDITYALISDCLFSAGQWEEGLKYIKQIRSPQIQEKAKEFATESLFKSPHSPKTISDLIEVFSSIDLGSGQAVSQSNMILLARFLPSISSATTPELDQLSIFAEMQNQPLHSDFIFALSIPLYMKAGEIDKAKTLISKMQSKSTIVMGLLSLAVAGNGI